MRSRMIRKYTAHVFLLQFVNAENVLSASSDGSVRLFHVGRSSGEAEVTERTAWEGLHYGKYGFTFQRRIHILTRYFPSSGVPLSCNGLDCLGDQAVSAGEDGRLFLLSLRHSGAAAGEGGEPIRAYDKADSCSLTTAIFVTDHEVRQGQFRL